MESTRDIKGRIKSVTNIQQITKAMKMVAAARLRKAEEKANGSRPYAEKIGELLRRVYMTNMQKLYLDLFPNIYIKSEQSLHHLS